MIQGRKDSNSLGSSGSNNSSGISKTPSANKSPSRAAGFGRKSSAGLSSGKVTPGGKNKNLTPSRNHNGPKTPGGGDRFVPNRSASCQELANYMLSSNQSQSDSQTSISLPTSPNKSVYQRIMSEQLNGGVTGPQEEEGDKRENNFRILAYQKGKAPSAPGYSNMNKVLYTARATPANSCSKGIRHIPSTPERVLDAPEILDDYYLNLIDWSDSNLLAVALGGQVYLWNAESGGIELLLELESPTDSVTSVSFAQKQTNTLAVGDSNGNVALYDVSRMRRLRVMGGHSQRVGALAWNGHICTSGARNGMIHHHDVRTANHLVATLAGHTQEVCGLRWSVDGRWLASGGNDNLLQIWPQVPNEFHSATSPIATFTDHLAAVKALSWCPWQGSLLASGGGTADRCIRIWNISTATCVATVDTESQVCSLLWSGEYKELISAHGYPNNQLSIWKYPKMNKIAELEGHSGRVLGMAMSPCGQLVVSAAADETLRIWRCFAVDAARQKKAAHPPRKESAMPSLR